MMMTVLVVQLALGSAVGAGHAAPWLLSYLYQRRTRLTPPAA